MPSRPRRGRAAAVALWLALIAWASPAHADDHRVLEDLAAGQPLVMQIHLAQQATAPTRIPCS